MVEELTLGEMKTVKEAQNQIKKGDFINLEEPLKNMENIVAGNNLGGFFLINF